MGGGELKGKRGRKGKFGSAKPEPYLKNFFGKLPIMLLNRVNLCSVPNGKVGKRLQMKTIW